MVTVTVESQPEGAITCIDDLDTDMILHLPLTEGEGEIAHNASLYGDVYDGVIHGAMWGDVGLVFDGNNYIAIGDLGIGNSYTAGCWIKTDRIDCAGYNCSIIASSAIAGTYPLWLTIQGTEINSYAYQSSSTGTLTSGANIDTVNWFHIVQTAISGSVTKVYINGVEKLSYINVGTNTWSDIFTVGDLRPDRLLNFAGIIGDIEIYARVLRTEEVVAMFEAERGRYGI